MWRTLFISEPPGDHRQKGRALLDVSAGGSQSTVRRARLRRLQRSTWRPLQPNDTPLEQRGTTTSPRTPLPSRSQKPRRSEGRVGSWLWSGPPAVELLSVNGSVVWDAKYALDSIQDGVLRIPHLPQRVVPGVYLVHVRTRSAEGGEKLSVLP